MPKTFWYNSLFHSFESKRVFIHYNAPSDESKLPRDFFVQKVIY